MLGRTVLLIGLLLSANLFAEPRQWDADGIPVRAVSVIADYSSAQSEDGTKLILWENSTGSEPEIWGQLISPAGAFLWAEGGIQLTESPDQAGMPKAAAVDGGWVIVWLDFTYSSPWSADPTTGWYGLAAFRAIKIDNNGAPVWNSGRTGIEIAEQSEWYIEKAFSVNPSGGGVIVTWEPGADHWAQKVSSDGQIEWPDPVHLKARYSSSRSDVCSDMQGGIALAWSEIRAGDTLLVVNRLLPNGTFAWNDTSGAIVRTDDEYFFDITIAADGAGGIFVAWFQDESPTNVYAQRVNSDGQTEWPATGVLMFANNNSIDLVDVKASRSSTNIVDGMLTLCVERNADPKRYLLQKVSMAGNVLWGEEAETVCQISNAEGDLESGYVLSDDAGGAIVFENIQLYDAGNFNHFIKVQWIAADQSRPWGNDCGTIAGSSAYLWFDRTAPSLSGQIVQVAWLNPNYYVPNQLLMRQLDFVTGQPLTPEPVVLAEADGRGVRNVQAVKLSNGATALVWESPFVFEYTLRFQILDVFGEPMFGEEGLPLCETAAGQPIAANKCTLCPDGSGGFFAAFRAFEAGVYRFRSVHVNGQGQHVSDSDGEVLYNTQQWWDVENSRCLPDGEGGCFVSTAIYNEQFYLTTITQRINAQCQAMWETPVTFADNEHDTHPIQLVPSNDGSCILLFTPYRFQEMNIRAAKLSPDGNIVWNNVIQNGVQASYYDGLQACSDMQNGCNVVWSTRSADDIVWETRAQKISPTGQLLWPTSGVLMAQDSAFELRNLSCGADRVGNLTVAWTRFNNSDTDVISQRVSTAGVALWGNNGLPVCLATGDQDHPKTFVMSDNEVYFVWTDRRGDPAEYWEGDIYAAHMNAHGQIGDDSYWQVDGSPVCNYRYRQSDPTVIADEVGGIIVAWSDQRTTFDWEGGIFAQRMFDPIFTNAEEMPELPTAFSLSQNYPNPFNPETVIEFALPNASKATLRVFGITGREVATLVDDQLTAGNHRVSFDGSTLASGVYFYSLRTASQSLTRKMVLLK